MIFWQVNPVEPGLSGLFIFEIVPEDIFLKKIPPYIYLSLSPI